MSASIELKDILETQRKLVSILQIIPQAFQEQGNANKELILVKLQEMDIEEKLSVLKRILEQRINETRSSFEKDLFVEVAERGLGLVGKYPKYVARHGTHEFLIDVVDPYNQALVSGLPIQRATASRILKTIVAISRSRLQEEADIGHFVEAFTKCYEMLCSISGSASGVVKLIDLFRVLRTAYLTKGLKVQETNMLQECLSKNLVELELLPGKSPRDFIHLIDRDGVRRAYVWVRIRQKA